MREWMVLIRTRLRMILAGPTFLTARNPPFHHLRTDFVRTPFPTIREPPGKFLYDTAVFDKRVCSRFLYIDEPVKFADPPI